MVYSEYRSNVISEAAGAGHDSAKAALVWDACVQVVHGWNLMEDVQSIGDAPDDHKSAAYRRRVARRHEKELRKAACGVLGISLFGLFLSSLFSVAIRALIEWVISRVQTACAEISPRNPVGYAGLFFPEPA